MKTISMQINQANLVKSLQFSFTNSTTVLGELMQNARRAKATHVVFECSELNGDTVLTVSDNGEGIDSIETLLTVAESGWDAHTVAQEHPFGMGFLSALFACRHITVTSKSGLVAANTESILAFEPINVVPIEQWDGLTTIRLAGTPLTELTVQSALTTMAEGFPIPVWLNGVELPRTKALDGVDLDFVQTEIGQVHVQGLNAHEAVTDAMEVFLQGLPIYRSRYCWRNNHVIHLDSALFRARLPDRDTLVDEAEVIRRVKAVIKQLMTDHLTRLKVSLAPHEFVGYYPQLEFWQCLHLLNDVSIVPRQVLAEVTNSPNANEQCIGTFSSVLEHDMEREQLANVRVFSIDADVKYDGGSLHYLFVKALKGLVYARGLDEGHWLLPMIETLTEPGIERVGETHGAQFRGQWVSTYVIFCDSYRITFAGETVEIADEAVYTGQDGSDQVIVPAGDCSGWVVGQVSNYYDEFDTFQEGLYEADVDAFGQFTVANTTDDPASAFKRLLTDFSGCPLVFGKSFNVTLDDKGSVLTVQGA